ncbi:MAG TPA: DUF4902 domain-containing protein [Albitalea sp.]|uniref:DUF4902 domain-containing protein n=1 Tax=Piscinibacter sp. TaxID=1903157 RepID=UPI002ED2FC82
MYDAECRMSCHDTQRHSSSMHVSRDGLIRASIAELLSMRIVHLMSGIDVEHNLSASACGRPTTISGYTEWVTQTEPPITIGWDWCLVTSADDPSFQRASQPRANVMLVDDSGNDKSWSQNLERLATVVDVLPWVEFVPRTVFR